MNSAFGTLASNGASVYLSGQADARSLRLSVRTPGFQPGKRGSIPLGTANRFEQLPIAEAFSRPTLRNHAGAISQFEQAGTLRRVMPNRIPVLNRVREARSFVDWHIIPD